MDATRVREIAQSGEDLNHEFKRADPKDRLSDDAIVEALVCMANADGGTVLLGVEDDGTITGCAVRHGEVTDPLKLEALVRGRTEPPLSVNVSIVAVDDVNVAVIDVPRARQPVQTSRGAFPRRQLDIHGNPQCRAMTAAEIQAMALTSGDVDFATHPAFGATVDDIDSTECVRYLRTVEANSPQSPLLHLGQEELLRALDLARLESSGDLSLGLGAILLFGTDQAVSRFFPNHEVQFQVLRGTRLTRNETISGPLLKVLDRLDALLSATIIEEEFDMGLLRVLVPLVSPRAAREAVINALVHRDYFERGAVRIEFRRDQFSVTSPGTLPRGVTVANILDSSTPRSKAIASVMQRAGLAERAGTGVDVMYEESLALGQAAPSFARTDNHRVVVDFELGHPDVAIVRYLRERRGQSMADFDLLDLQILRTVKLHGDASLHELDEEVTYAGASLVPAITRMVEQGVLEPRGVGRGRRYHLSAEFYRTAGQATAYARMRGLSRDEMRAEVRTAVEVHGSVTRGKVAELCHISPTQARTLLKGMVDDGQLTLIGEKRAARYSAPHTAAD
jgi:ATP-dependent DNA helicase RecG